MTDEPDAPPATGDGDLADLYEHAPCGYLSTLPDGTIVRVNETLLEWTGYRRAELLGKRFVELLTVPGRIFHDTHFAPLLAMQGAVRELALDLVRPHARPLPTIVNSVVRRDASGQVVLHRTALFDATHRRRYEQELLAARRAAERATTSRDAMLSMLSHDMRSPLNNILMAVQLAAETTDDAERSSYYRMIETASHAVLELVNAILEHSRLEAGKSSWARAPLDLHALADELGAIFAVMAESKGLRFAARVDPKVPAHVLGDRFKLGQILTNLVSNAIKFTHEGEVRLEIRVLTLARQIVRAEFAVCDTGIGIAREHVASIFDEYDRASPETAARYAGTGLGLAICRKLVALAGSSIDVSSEPGVGSVFSFVLALPVADEPVATDAPAI